MASSVDGPRLSSPVSLPDDPDESDPDEPDESEPDEPEVLVEPEEPDELDDPLLEQDEDDGEVGAWTGGGFSATVTFPGPSSEIATKATAVDVIANAITTPVMIAGTRQRRPLRASAVPHSKHHSWPSCTRAPQVAQVVPSGASWTGASSGGSPGPGGRSSRAVAAPFSLGWPLAEESVSADSERSRRRRSVLTIFH